MTAVRVPRPAVRVCAAAVAVALLAGCAAQRQRTASPQSLDRIRVVLQGPQGHPRVEIVAEDAYLPETREVGLMHRTELPEHEGMVFRYGEDRTGGYWMRTTLIPLSIAYFADDGTVVDVRDMEPCTADPCPLYPPDAPYRGALEVNKGFFDQIGLDVGWRVVLPANLPAPR